MSIYEILPPTYLIAKKLGIKIQPSSSNSKKKINIYDFHGNFIFSIGEKGYGDYFTYLKKYGKEYANERRRLYISRHHKDIKIIGSAGYYSYFLLWNGKLS